MRTIKMKSGGTAYLLSKGDAPVPGEVCFTDKEYARVHLLAQSFIHSPEELREFWGTIIEKKRTVPSYTIWDDFPDVTPSLELSEKARLAKSYCAPILEMLRRGKPLDNPDRTEASYADEQEPTWEK